MMASVLLAWAFTFFVQDGKSLSALAVAAYLTFAGVFPQPKSSLVLYGRRRFPDGHRGLVLPSHKR